MTETILTPEETAKIENDAKEKALAEAKAKPVGKLKPLSPAEKAELARLEKLANNGRRQPAPGQMFQLSELRARNAVK